MDEREKAVIASLTTLRDNSQVAIDEINEGSLDSRDLRIAIKAIQESGVNLIDNLHAAKMTGAFGPIDTTS